MKTLNPTMAKSKHSRLRSGLRWGVVHAVLWGIGNALTTGPLLMYMAMDMGAKGTALSWILAAPALGGVFRALVPWVLPRLGGTKRGALILFVAAYVVLIGQPLAALPWPERMRPSIALVALIVCVHQLLEYMGQAALWGWLGGIVPRSYRGRYFALRETAALIFIIPVMILSGYFADEWRNTIAVSYPAWQYGAYAITGLIGTLFLWASIWPLGRLPARRPLAKAPLPRWEELIAPLRIAEFRALLRYGCWVAAANGLTQSAQNFHPRAALGVQTQEMSWLRTIMRLGQAVYSVPAGRMIDRYGAVPVMIVSQLLASLGLFCLFLSSMEQRWLIYVTWIAFSAFAGLNIGLPTLCLNLTSGQDKSQAVAIYFGVTGAVYALATVAGGMLFDWFADYSDGSVTWRGITWSHFQVFFLIGFVLRILSVVWLWPIWRSKKTVTPRGY